MNIDCYQYANRKRRLKPGDEGYNSSEFAEQAMEEMEAAGWKAVGYNDCGQVVYAPPPQRQPKGA